MSPRDERNDIIRRVAVTAPHLKVRILKAGSHPRPSAVYEGEDK